MNLVIQICADLEWKSAKQILKIKTDKLHRQPFGEYFEYPIALRESIFYQSGATKTLSAAACQFAIDTWHPDAVVNLGTCGGVSDNIRKLDIIMATKTVQYDVIQRFGEPSHPFYKPMITSVDTSWVDIGLVPEKIQKGTIATADQDLNYKNRKRLQEKDILGADWESGAISKVCELNKMKCLILRGVTDIPKEEVSLSKDIQASDYKNNTLAIMKCLFKIIGRISIS